MNLNMDNCWGIISGLINLCLDQLEHDGERARREQVWAFGFLVVRSGVVCLDQLEHDGEGGGKGGNKQGGKAGGHCPEPKPSCLFGMQPRCLTPA